jgi:predicted Zn-dependent protease with MMP-like domain
MAEWCDEPLDKRRVCQKRRRTATCPPQALDTLPAEWRELLARWVLRGGNSHWETLCNDAGTNRVQLAYTLLDWLLRSGWAAVTQQWKHGDWLPQRVELLHQPELRKSLGLRNKDDEAQRWQETRTALQTLDNDALALAILALDDLPVQRALARYDLILKLHDWQAQQQSGTRRNFAFFARGDTKAVNDSEWNWLETVLDPAEFGIERHTPLLLIAAPLALTSPNGQIDMASCADFAALTPATVRTVSASSGAINRWQLVENRTSFENVARKRDGDTGVIWLPGFPPTWWREAVGHLLDLAPAPACIACDPDPAGIAIALKAAELWHERSIAWEPWKMSAINLESLRVRKPLTEGDRQLLATLRQKYILPAQFTELLEWMLKQGEKGEQEGYL